MTWLDPVLSETVTRGDGTPLSALVSEHAPSAQAGSTGQTMQRIKLLVSGALSLLPPERITVRGVEVRVLGTQAPPMPGEAAIVTCERVNPDLPDDIKIIRLEEAGSLDDETGRFAPVEEELWEGAAHVVSGVPATVESAGADAPLDKVTVTTPLSAPYAAGLHIRIATTRTPGIPGADFVMSGEVLDSTADLRRVIAYRF